LEVENDMETSENNVGAVGGLLMAAAEIAAHDEEGGDDDYGWDTAAM
jgi:hypothetical protein